MDLTIKVKKKNEEYVATCPELDVHCFGPSRDKATARLKSVIQFYFDSASDLQLDADFHEVSSPDEPQVNKNPANQADYLWH